MVEFDLKEFLESIQLEEDSVLPDPEMVDMYRLRKQRIFYIDYEIDRDDRTGYSRLIELSKTITAMNIEEMSIPKDNLKNIYILINSYGGSLSDSFFFADLIKASRIPIITIATGVAMSAGFIILLAGHKRYAFEHSQILCHQGSFGMTGTASEVQEATKNYNKMLEKMKQYILANTSIPEGLFEKNKKKDWFLEPEYLMRYNGLDGIINSLEDLFNDNVKKKISYKAKYNPDKKLSDKKNDYRNRDGSIDTDNNRDQKPYKRVVKKSNNRN